MSLFLKALGPISLRIADLAKLREGLIKSLYVSLLQTLWSRLYSIPLLVTSRDSPFSSYICGYDSFGTSTCPFVAAVGLPCE